MNWPRRKHFPLLIFTILTLLILCGFQKEDKVELLESGLIDLDKAIDTAPFGVTEPGLSITDEASEEQEGTEELNETDDFSADYDSEEYIEVRVRGEDIYVGHDACNPDRLREELKTRSKGGKTVRLYDDYADASTYEHVLEILDDLHRSIGLNYE